MKKTGIKTATFALVHFTVAFSVAWMLTGSVVIGGAIAMVEPAINTVAYAIHEQLWSRKSRSTSQSHSELNLQGA